MMMMLMLIRGRRITRSHQSRTLSLLGEDSSSLRLAMISKGPSNVAKNLEEDVDSLILRLETISKGPSHVAKKTHFLDLTSNPSSGISVLSSVLDGFSIPKSKKKKRARKTGEDARRKLDQPLSKVDDWILSSRHNLGHQLMDAESSGGRDSCPNTFLVTPSDVSCLEDASIVNVDKGILTGTETKLADHSHADISRLLQTNAAEHAALMAEVVNRCDSLATTELECVRLRDELAKYKTLLIEQVQDMDLILHDYAVQMQTIEAENSGLVDRLSQAEVLRVKAETQSEHSEALRADANKKMLSLEASNSELVNRLELLESEKKRLVERVAVLEAADTERMGS